MVMMHGGFTGSIAMMSGKISKAINHMFVFSYPDTNAIIYCSFLIITSEYSSEGEKGGDDTQDTDFISLSHFELLK